MDKLLDYELIELYRLKSDEKALITLIERYKNSVEAIAKKFVVAQLEHDDLIQEGMIGFLAAVSTFDANKSASFSTYSKTCVNNSIASALRKLSRMKDIPYTKLVSLENDELNNHTAKSAEDVFLDKERLESFNKMLYEELSSFENDVLRLWMTSYSYNEIAKKLDKNPKAIDNAIQRIRKKLNGVTF